MTKLDTLLAILELDCNPDTLITRTAWIAQSFGFNVHLVLFEPQSGALLGRFAASESNLEPEPNHFMKRHFLDTPILIDDR